jgi:PAS domain S-box-containing protein
MTKPVQTLRSEATVGTGPEPVSIERMRSQIAALESSVKSLEERLAVYETVFFANPVPALIYAVETLELLEFNSSALKLYGYDPVQFSRLNLLELFSPDPRHDLGELANELRQEQNSIGPVIHRRCDNRPLVVRLILFPFSVDGVAARIVMVEDATARQLAEEEMRASEERFRELFENANDVIFIHDLKGKIIAVNRAAEYMTGYERSEVLGKSFEELVAPEARNQTQDSIRAHLGGSATQHYELPLLSKFGTVRYLEVSTRIVYRGGHPVAIQGIGRDVTERKYAQQKLQESSEELHAKNAELLTALRQAREATQLKEQFLANTSHELRTPMNGIMGMVNLLKTTQLSEDQQEYAEAVSQCADDLLTIINDLLDLSQIDAGRLALNYEPFDPIESLRAVAKMLRLRAEAKELTLSLEIEPAAPTPIYGDSVRFRQVLTNLIANALKFTQSGGVTVRMLADEPGMLRCEVIDSGIGVDDCVRERIFEAFFQADGTTRRRFGGTGLGLTISKQLVEIMGGRIGTFNNRPGPGSTFWFEVPVEAGKTNAQGARYLEAANL